jgi:hypothetical protein
VGRKGRVRERKDERNEKLKK